MIINGAYKFMFLLSYVLVITTAALEYRDPGKTFFTFGNDEEDNTEPDSDYTNNENEEENHESSKYLEKYNTCVKEKRNLCKHWLDFLRLIVNEADDSAIIQKLSFDLTLTQSELGNVKQILRSGKCPEEATFVLKNIYPRSTWNIWLQEELNNLIITHKEIIGLITVIFIIFLLLMYWLRISKSLWRAAVKMFCLAYIASIVMTWYRNYLKELSKKRLILKDGIPLACRPNDQSYFYSFWLFVKNQWSVMPDDCSIYFEADTIDPLFGATILDAVSETTTRFILTPIPLIFEYSGLALRKLFQILPAYLWIPVTVGVLIIVIVNIFVHHKYRIRTIFGSIEPAAPLPVNQPALYSSTPVSVPPVSSNSQIEMTPRSSENQVCCASKHLHSCIEHDCRRLSLPSAVNQETSEDLQCCTNVTLCQSKAVSPIIGLNQQHVEHSECCRNRARWRRKTENDLSGQRDLNASFCEMTHEDRSFEDGDLSISRSLIEDISDSNAHGDSSTSSCARSFSKSKSDFDMNVPRNDAQGTFSANAKGDSSTSP